MYLNFIYILLSFSSSFYIFPKDKRSDGKIIGRKKKEKVDSKICNIKYKNTKNKNKITSSLSLFHSISFYFYLSFGK